MRKVCKMEVFQKIKELNKKLVDFKDNKALGLANGKMGRCIYFSCISKSKEYESIVSQLIDDIYSQIDSLLFHDIKTGWMGIGLGINFLIENNHLKGDVNVVLKDIDTAIIKLLNKSSFRDNLSIFEQNQFLYYLYIRLLSQKKGRELETIFQEYSISLINNLHEKIDAELFDGPLYFDVDYPLPLLLYVLSRISNLNFYNYKIDRVLQDISFQILSKIPFLHANRLYLIWGIEAINKQMQNKNWENHICLLRREFDFYEMLNNEFGSRNIYFNNGLPAAYLLIKVLPDYFTQDEMNEYNRQIIKKIEQSSEWEKLLNDEDYFKLKSGLFDGWSGTSLLLHYENRLK